MKIRFFLSDDCLCDFSSTRRKLPLISLRVRPWQFKLRAMISENTLGRRFLMCIYFCQPDSRPCPIPWLRPVCVREQTSRHRPYVIVVTFLLSASFQPHPVPSAPHHLDSFGWLAYFDVCPVGIFLSLLTSSVTRMQYAHPFCVGKPTIFISSCSCQYANRNRRVLRCFAFRTFCFCTHHFHAIRNSQFVTFFREACTSIEPHIVEKCLKRNQRRFSLCPPPYFSQGLVTFARTTQSRALRHNHHTRDTVPFVLHFQPSLNSEQQWVRWTASHISGLRISASH